MKKTLLFLIFAVLTASLFGQMKVLNSGDVYIPGGKSYWINSSSDAGNRLRLHHNGSNAYIDYYPGLNFRYGTSTVLSLNSRGFGSTTWANWTDVTLDWSYECCSSPVLYPSNDWYLQLGKRNQRVGTLWVTTIHYWDGCYKESDFRAKDNIKSISGVKKDLNKLNVVSFNYKPSQFSKMPDNVRQRLTSNQIGLIAQDVEKIYPNLVITDDSTGLKAVDYVGFVPLIIQALKEQDSIISAQNEQIKALQKLINSGNKLKSTSEQMGVETTESIVSAILDQNAPNPFSQTTQIGYYLPEAVQKAVIYIYDMNGTQLKSFPINQKGKGSITINGSKLRPGMYLYTLIADGKEIDTKRMILTE
jgi:hypothetical protein